MKDYQKNQWTVSSRYEDSIQATKSVALPDLDYANDHKKIMDEPNEAKVVNVTGTELVAAEHIRFAQSTVKNIYSTASVNSASTPVNKEGVQVMVELDELYRAVHDTTGESIDLPCKGRVVLRFPTHQCVTPELVVDLLYRTISSAMATGSTDASRLAEMARGSLLPDGI